MFNFGWRQFVVLHSVLSVYIPKSWLNYQRRKKQVATKERMILEPEYIDRSRDCTDYVFCKMRSQEDRPVSTNEKEAKNSVQESFRHLDLLGTVAVASSF
jgi:hypothetical protein